MAARTASGAARKLKVVDDEHYATIGQVQDFAEELSDAHLHCRELGHLWRPHSAGRYKDGGFERVLRCNRCRTRRQQTLTGAGMVQTNKYIYPDGYQAKGLGRIVGEGRGILRIASITRVIDKNENKEAS